MCNEKTENESWWIDGKKTRRVKIGEKRRKKSNCMDWPSGTGSGKLTRDTKDLAEWRRLIVNGLLGRHRERIFKKKRGGGINLTFYTERGLLFSFISYLRLLIDLRIWQCWTIKPGNFPPILMEKFNKVTEHVTVYLDFGNKS